jgi:hypothetical protein
VEREIAAWAVADLVVGHRVEVLVDQPGWAVVLLWEAGGAGVLVRKETTVRSYSALASPLPGTQGT